MSSSILLLTATDAWGAFGKRGILATWNPVFVRIPVESLVYAHQQEYYRALQESTAQGQSAPFIEFMLSMIQNAVPEMDTPQVAPQVTPQVERILSALSNGPSSGMMRKELQAVLSLKDRKSFRQLYLLPALQSGFIEMSLPEKPNSRLQKYRLTARAKASAHGHTGEYSWKRL